MLGGLGLELHPDKTKIVHAEKGFDFLGMYFRLCSVRKKESRLRKSCRIWPSDSSGSRIKQRVREVIGQRYSKSLEDMITSLNPVLRSWDNYHKVRGIAP